MSTALSLVPPPAPAARVAPHSLEAEQALLGAILLNAETMDRVRDLVTPEAFYEPVHRAIFENCRKLSDAGRAVTPITLKTFLGDVDLGGVTAPQYIARLVQEATTVVNATDYARMIQDLAVRRQLIRIGEEMAAVAHDPPLELAPRQQIEETERKLYDLAERGRIEAGFQGFTEAARQAIAMASAAYNRKGTLSGIGTGLRDLDQKMGGLQRSDLIIIAGRPGMGKTALATNIAFNIARDYRAQQRPDGALETRDGGIVGFFSLEMSAEQLATRIIAEQAGVPSFKIRRGDMQPSEWSRLVDAARAIQELPLHIDQTGGISIAQLATRARRLKRQRGLDVLVVDYIQLMTGASRRGDNRVQELTEITTGLKALAKELNVPLIALSQLSRQVENRDDKRPQLSDLRESGSIEQDADVVLFVYREEYYLKNRQPREGTEEFLKWQQEMERAHGRAEVIIGKQRHGPTGTVELQFEADVTRFSDLAREDQLPERL